MSPIVVSLAFYKLQARLQFLQKSVGVTGIFKLSIQYYLMIVELFALVFKIILAQQLGILEIS